MTPRKQEPLPWRIVHVRGRSYQYKVGNSNVVVKPPIGRRFYIPLSDLELKDRTMLVALKYHLSQRLVDSKDNCS